MKKKYFNSIIIFSTLIFFGLIYLNIFVTNRHKEIATFESPHFRSIHISQCGPFSCLRFDCSTCTRKDINLSGNPDLLVEYSTQKMISALSLLSDPLQANTPTIQILNIGLLAATIPSYIKHTLPEVTYSIVEKNPDLVEAVTSYFPFWPDDFTVYTPDNGVLAWADTFIKNNEKKFDCIFVVDTDLEYVDNDHIEKIFPLLKPDGILVYRIERHLTDQDMAHGLYTNMPSGYEKWEELFAQTLILSGGFSDRSSVVFVGLCNPQNHLVDMNDFANRLKIFDIVLGLGEDSQNLPYSKALLFSSISIINRH